MVGGQRRRSLLVRVIVFRFGLFLAPAQFSAPNATMSKVPIYWGARVVLVIRCRDRFTSSGLLQGLHVSSTHP